MHFFHDTDPKLVSLLFRPNRFSHSMAFSQLESKPKLQEAKRHKSSYLDLALAFPLAFGVLVVAFGAVFAFPAAVNSGLIRFLGFSGPAGSGCSWRFLVFAKSASTDLT